MTVAVIIPSIDVDPLLVRCVRECRRVAPDSEIIALVDDGTGREQIDDLATVIVCGPITIGAKRNLGARSTAADYVAFIDSDAYPADGWLDNAVRHLESDPAFAAIGGPNVSPPDEPRSERHVGLAHNSFLVAGWWKYRRDPNAHDREVGALPSCNLVVRHSDYDAVEGMNAELFTAEDTDFCRRFTDSGRRIRFSPDVLVFHKNRDMRAFTVQRFTFGVAMVPLLRKGRAPDLGYTAASGVIAVFVLVLASGPLGLLFPRWRRWWGLVLATYVTVLGIETVRQVEDPHDAVGTFMALAIGNLAPGVGVVAKAVGASPDLRGIYRNDR